MDHPNVDEMTTKLSTLAKPDDKGYLGGVLRNVDAVKHCLPRSRTPMAPAAEFSTLQSRPTRVEHV
jgi:hypothetical protein